MIISQGFAEPEQFPVPENGPIDWLKSFEKGKSIHIPLPPLKQIKTGIPFDEIQCRENRVLVQKQDGSPACVKPESVPKLIHRGLTPKIDSIGIGNSNLALHYSIYGGELISADGYTSYSSGIGKITQTSLLLTLETKEDGTLVLFLPRNLMDSKWGQNDDDNFFVVLDENETNYNESKTDYDRIVSILFPTGTK